LFAYANYANYSFIFISPVRSFTGNGLTGPAVQ